jgi:hypothetical protein
MNFVILTIKRSGSSYLAGLLGRHPKIYCHYEIFKRSGVPIKADIRDAARAEELKALRDSTPHLYLEKMAELNLGRPIVGFKMQATQHPDMMAVVLKSRRIKKIVLKRENVLARYASALAARQAGYGVNAAKPRVKFDPAQFEGFLEEHKAFYSYVSGALAESDQDGFPLLFEHLNCRKTIGDALRFLGVTKHVPSREPPPNRAGPDTLSRFTNPAVALAFLRAHGLDHWQSESRIEPSA